MDPYNWAPEHCAALREYVARGMSYAEIADAINARFGTDYTRNATLGRGKRMGLVGPKRPERGPKAPPKTRAPRPPKICEPSPSGSSLPAPAPERAEPVKLRCVGITPRLLSLIELEPGDCRYPYGGDKESEAIAFCGHPRLAGSSYCAPHFHLTRDPEIPLSRAAGPVSLRLVDAA